MSSCTLCVDKTKNDAATDLIAYPSTLGRLDATWDNEVLVLDIGDLGPWNDMSHWSDASHRYILVGKLLSRQFLLVEPLTSRSCSTKIKDWLRQHPYVKVLVHDNAVDFSPADTFAKSIGVRVEPSHLHRDALKRFQERAVGQAKELLSWCIKASKATGFKKLARNWNHLTVMVSWIHNSRVSPKIRSVPWSLTYANPLRSDLFPFQIVNVISETRISPLKSKTRVLLGLKSPTTAVVWDPKVEKSVEEIHPSQLRVIRPSVDFVIGHFASEVDEVVASLGSLAATSERLPPNFRRLSEWPLAVRTHAEKLLAMDPVPISKLDDPLLQQAKVSRAFFTGQIRDGVMKARLVVDNGEIGSPDDVVLNELPPMAERLALLSVMEDARSRNPLLEVRAGDISGAYYATRATGYLRLPSEWPPGAGGFQPGEVVRSNCAMPGCKLGSGLFLTQLESRLTSFPRKHGNIRVGEGFVGCNYSDDLIGIGTPDAWKQLEKEIAQQYSVVFEPGYPQRWVGMDFNLENGVLWVGCSSTCDKYDVPEVAFPTLDEFALIKPTEKSDDDEAKSEAKIWAGRLNYLATLHPTLAYSATFLASAMHYLPQQCLQMCQRIIRAVQLRRPSFPIFPVTGKFCVLYVDAAQDLQTCRATAGLLVQMQDCEEPEALHNPIYWSSKR